MKKINKSKELDPKSTASGVPQVTKEGSQAGSGPKGDIVNDSKMDMVRQGSVPGGRPE